MTRADKIRQAIGSGAGIGRIACLCILAVFGIGHVFGARIKVQSPRAASLSGGAIMEQSTASASSLAAPSVAAITISTNRFVKVSLAWDASPDHASITNYSVLFGAVSHVYTNSVNAGTNLSVTISNLQPNTRYYFAAQGTARDGITSALTPEIFWPLPQTNFVTAIVSRRTNLTAPETVIWSQTIAVPPGTDVFFASAISVTNNSVSVTRINSSTLRFANTNQP